MIDEPSTFEVSSGNVFADLGVPDPDTALAKSRLAQQIASIVAERGWTQARTAAVFEIDQPNVSRVLRGRVRGFSAERLINLLVRLDQDVEIRVHANPEPARPAHVVILPPGTPIVSEPRLP